MRRNSRRMNQEPGQDSFLDIVANLVGILIILVMVVGARAKDAMITTPAKDPVEVSASHAAATSIENGIHELQAKISRQQFEIDFRRNERDKMFAVIRAVELKLAEQEQNLDQAQRDKLAAAGEMNRAQRELEDLKLSREAVVNAASQPIVIGHLPTPMAKTVFGKEIHFRLKGGRVAFIPWDELVDRLKNEAKDKVWKLKDQPMLTETIGPVQGFRMKYTLRRVDRAVMTSTGPVTQNRVELDYFHMLPVNEAIGEPLQVALRENSEFHAAIAGQNRDRTTITVWVYADSFDAFRVLKEDLYKLGFLTASRPLPDDAEIGASPNGTRSAAQ